MEKNIKTRLKFLIMFSCILFAGGSGFAKDKNIDISVGDITFPEKVYLNQKATVDIVLTNNSDVDVKDCKLNIEADDGSKVSSAVPLPKNASQKVELQWVPQRQGKINFKVTLVPPKGIQVTDEKNTQATKTIEVLAQ